MVAKGRAVRTYPLCYACRIIILLLATLFQTHQLTQDIRFHPDEAFFMTFARHAAVNGDWMLAGSLDKPPLSIYTSALSMVLVGNTSDSAGVLHLDPLIGEFAGRLPNVIFASLLVALMMRLVYDLYQDERMALVTGVLVVTSPYILSFGATAFTDMSLLFWLVLSLWLMTRQRWGWAGLAYGLALWSKQQALFFLPLLMIVAVVYRSCSCADKLKALVSGVIMVLLLVLWDTSRPETSIFLLGTVNNSPDGLLADPSSYLSRLFEWLNLGSWLLSQGWMTLLLVCFAIVGWLYHIVKRDKMRQIDTVFVLFIVSYLILHIVLALNQYDRYLLIIVPLIILLCARGLNTILKHTPSLSYVLAVMLIILALYGLKTGFPIGGDKGDNQGIDQLADYLNNKPIATVIYDRWLGWELAYYMGQWTNKRRVHYPTPQALADGAQALDEIGERYLVAPINQPVTTWLDALEAVGFTVEVDYQSSQFKVYRLTRHSLDA